MKPLHFTFISALFIINSLVSVFSAEAQSVIFDDDRLLRGYHDRPWLRYEAEQGCCVTNGTILTPPDQNSYTQTLLQAEASNLSATLLSDKGQYVEWITDAPGRGLTIRFSLPDSPEGNGVSGNLLLSVDGKEISTITLDSRWAWQYTPIAYSQDKYPDNTPADSKFARMRFDEVAFLLDRDIPKGAAVRLIKDDDNAIPYCIDFLEIEPVASPLSFESIESPDKVRYDGSTSLQAFISANPGRTIFIPEGRYELDRQLHITAQGTRIIGAGMWHTTIFFSTPSNSRNNYNARGIHCNVSDVTLTGMTLDTANDKRYFDNNPAYQVGKGLNGSWGENSTVSHLRISHFECGAWIMGAKGLRVEHCRMRNNYADGINLANNSSRCVVTHCSFRNNGDDDMASWSTGSYASDNEFSYCTAENNWRASSLGFFGGQRNSAHHIAIYDAMEAGARVVCDFDGTGFSSEGYLDLHDISIRRAGARLGLCGEQGGFWGESAASLQISAGWAYDINNLRIHSIDIFNSRHDAISIKANSGKAINNLELYDINISGVDGYAFGINIESSVKGNGFYANIQASGVTLPFMADIPPAFSFVSRSDVDEIETSTLTPPIFYDISGKVVSSPNKAGIYIVKDNKRCYKLLIK